MYYSTQWNNNADKHPGMDYQTVRMTARSLTLDQVASAFNNEGMIYACQFSPNHRLMPEVGGPEFRDYIKKLVKSALDGADLTKGEFEVVPEEEPPFHLPPSGGQSGYRLVFQDWPWQPSQVVRVDPKNYEAKAAEGIYMPLKHTSDNLEYGETSVECYLSAVVPHSSDGSTTGVNVLESHGWTMGCILAAGLNEAASVNMKVITCLEATARSDSQLAKFVVEVPPLDKLAIDQTRRAMGNCPSAYPACYNALGSVLNVIAEALGGSGIPILSDIGRAATGVNRALGGAPVRLLDSIL